MKIKLSTKISLLSFLLWVIPFVCADWITADTFKNYSKRLLGQPVLAINRITPKLGVYYSGDFLVLTISRSACED
jgi:hypothetical protein